MRPAENTKNWFYLLVNTEFKFQTIQKENDANKIKCKRDSNKS